MIKKTPRHLTTGEAASYLGLSPRTLEKWRGQTVTGPPYLKLGGTVNLGNRVGTEASILVVESDDLSFLTPLGSKFYAEIAL